MFPTCPSLWNHWKRLFTELLQFERASPVAQHCFPYSIRAERCKAKSLNADPGKGCATLDFHSCRTGDISYLTSRKDCEKVFWKCWKLFGWQKNLLPEMLSFIKWCLLIYTKLLTISVLKWTLCITFSYLCLGGVLGSCFMFKLQIQHCSSASLLVFPNIRTLKKIKIQIHSAARATF